MWKFDKVQLLRKKIRVDQNYKPIYTTVMAKNI